MDFFNSPSLQRLCTIAQRRVYQLVNCAYGKPHSNGDLLQRMALQTIQFESATCSLRQTPQRFIYTLQLTATDSLILWPWAMVHNTIHPARIFATTFTAIAPHVIERQIAHNAIQVCSRLSNLPRGSDETQPGLLHHILRARATANDRRRIVDQP